MKRWLLVFIVPILVIVFYFVVADLLDTSDTPSYSIDEDVTNLYNITVNNTGDPPEINFTQVNITFPASFSINDSTNGTGASGTFVLDGQTLSWTNDPDLILNGTLNYFWVNATASTPGSYTITVTTLDTLLNTNSSTVSVTINDTTNPSISFSGSTPGNDSNFNRTYILVDVTVVENGVIDTITIFLFDSTGLINSSISTSSPASSNFSGLSDGVYYINATVNDTSGNKDSTDTRIITLNSSLTSTPSCTSSWNCTNWLTCSNGNQTRTCTDSNSCNNTLTKPNETQMCGSTNVTNCVVDWDCTDFVPLNECPKNETRERTCTDLNNCGTNEGKPDETRSCNYQSGTNWWIISIVITIISIISIAGFIIYLKNKSEDDTSPQPIQRMQYRRIPPYY